MRNYIVASVALALAAPTFAQAPAPAPVTAAVDPARLAAARQLIDVIMPQPKREAMIDAMMKGMMANMTQAILRSAEMKAAFESDPRAKGIFERFFAQQQSSTIALLKENFPGMVDAMGRAYARRFTTAQMSELETFFNTPTGRLYIDQASTVVTDPDVAAWQRDLMTKSMTRIPADANAMLAEIKALKAKGKTGG